MSEKPGFFTRVKNSVKGFIKGAAKAAPMTLLYSGGAFALSYALGQYNPDMDFLKVKGGETKMLVTRLFGSMVVGSTISGGIEAFKGFNEGVPSDPQPGADMTPQMMKAAELVLNQQRAQGAGVPGVNMNTVAPPVIPMGMGQPSLPGQGGFPGFPRLPTTNQR